MFYKAQSFTWLLALLAFSQPVAAAFSESQALTQGLANSKVSQGANGSSTTEIKFKICSESTTWTRPTAAEQRKRLQSSGRYSSEDIEQLGGDYWKKNIFSFTRFPGDSGNYDIANLSGLWKVQNATYPSKCDNYVNELNSGKIAGVWVLHHKVVNIKWVGNRYVMLVKPTGQGTQFIQFPRRERLESLPLRVVNESGKKVEVLADSIKTGSSSTTSAASSSSLVTAIRNAVGNDLSDFFDSIEYFYVEVDLNNDKNKEVIVYTAGPQCGAWECSVYIFKRSGNGYRLVGETGAASNEAQIAVLKSQNKGWLNIATLVYDSQYRKLNWKLHKFNGSVYQNTYQNLSSTPTRIILRPNRGSGINLAKLGRASQEW
ncbi:hypothetical protein NUACC21_17060 [Scytonema sp. NUACC21]